ncbi:MAG: WYL domain-containing protein [Bacteroidales bacterium]|nr:WYL domain-containing protein [Bacteroidales bacterium]
MSYNLLNRYIWLVDTIRRFGRITLAQINRQWEASEFYQGQPLPRRSFANYREGAQELFKITIACDPRTYEYYIEDGGTQHAGGVTSWLLNSAYTNDLLSHSHDLADRIFVENVPSAREHLGPVINAMRAYNPIKFDYHAYWRVNPNRGVVLQPYFLKIFRQRWYLTGRNTADNKIKTYALDRMEDVVVGSECFEPDPAFDADEYVSGSFGIVFSQGDVKEVALRTDSRQAKYLRALPLHHSQREAIHDNYSVFYYRLRLTPDLVQELLSMGSAVTVVSPPELRAMMVTQLRDTLANYDK